MSLLRTGTGGVPQPANTQESASRASSRLSVINWRTSRDVRRPRAARTASFWRRPSARASSRLATLAQAISRTHNDAPQQRQQQESRLISHILPQQDDRGVHISCCQREMRSSGEPPPRRASAPARGRNTGLSRAIALQPIVVAILILFVQLHRHPTWPSGWGMEIGRHDANHRARGSVEQHLPSSTAGSPPKCDCHMPQLRIMVPWRTIAVVARVKRVPSSGLNARIRKQIRATSAPSIRCGAPRSTRFPDCD